MKNEWWLWVLLLGLVGPGPSALSAAPASSPRETENADRQYEEQAALYKKFLSGGTVYTRKESEVLDAVATLASAKEAPALPLDRFLLWLHAGDWDSIGSFFDSLHPKLAREIHAKMVRDLAPRWRTSLMLPGDVLALAALSAGALEEEPLAGLGELLRQSMAADDPLTELVATLDRGVGELGGPRLAGRVEAARLLLAAGMLPQARQFLLTPAQLAELDEGDQPALRERTRELIARVSEPAVARRRREWDDCIACLRDPDASASSRHEALDELYGQLCQMAPPLQHERLSRLLGAEPTFPAATALLVDLGRRMGEVLAIRSANEATLARRSAHVELQSTVMKALVGTVGLGAPAWNTFANLLAKNWTLEAENSLARFDAALTAQKPDQISRSLHVDIEDLIEFAPREGWAEALSGPLRARVRLLTGRLLCLSDDIDRALEYIHGFATQDPAAAAALASQYLATWAKRNDPNLTAEARRRFQFDEKAIVLTRAQQQANLGRLSRLIEYLGPVAGAALNPQLAVEAFELCHSQAESYRSEDVALVFGPIERIPSKLILALLERMRRKLATTWRDIKIQKGADTHRSLQDTFAMVDRGYRDAVALADRWRETHPDDWRITALAGSLLSEWAEFAYFETLALETETNRFDRYLQRNQDGRDRFRQAAQSYAGSVETLPREERGLGPYLAWFHGLLGVSDERDVNLRKGVTDADLDELRAALLALPEGIAAAHLEMFAKRLAELIKLDGIAPAMKYKYLASALRITGRSPTVYPAQSKVQYFDSMLSEVRLESRLDGAAVIGVGQDFGVLLCLVHTAEMGRESGGFSQYLLNEVRRTFSGRSVVEKPDYRDKLEESLRVSLGDFFDIRAIVFADPKGPPRPAARQGWEETPLAYLHLAARDPTVDRVPPLRMELDFYDREGKVVLPVESPPILIEVSTGGAGPRPAQNLAVTQVLDARQLGEDRLQLEIVATADGLVPPLDRLIALESAGLPVLAVSEREGLLVQELHSSAESLHAVSQRSWQVGLDPRPLFAATGSGSEFRFPRAVSDDITVSYQSYEDMDPVEVGRQVTLHEVASSQGLRAARGWGLLAAGVLLTGILACVVTRYGFRSRRSERPSPLFVMPQQVTPFSVTGLLHRIERSPRVRMSEEEARSLREEITMLERSCFGPDLAAPLALREIAHRWLRLAETNGQARA